VAPATRATKKTEAWKAPVRSINQPKTTGMIMGPRFPSEEISPITVPMDDENLSVSAGTARMMVRTPMVENPARKMQKGK
jgi:hypothetical protein